MKHNEPQLQKHSDQSGAAHKWSGQVAQALSAADQSVVTELLGNIDPDAAKQIMANSRLQSRLAQMVEAAGYGLPVLENRSTAGVEPSTALNQRGFLPEKVMLAAFALAEAGQSVSTDKRKSLVLEFGEQLIQQLWQHGTKLLMALNSQEYTSLLTQSTDQRAEILSQYFLARGFNADSQNFKIGPTKLPLSLLDKALVFLKESDLNIAWPAKNMEQAA